MPNAFTLIELLVVITIIVVLLALLTPALEKAIYQAELAVCAANHHGIASGALVYASANRRKYPFRRLVHNKDLSEPDKIREGQHEDRPILQGYIALDLFNDPFVDKLDRGPDETQNDSLVWSSVDLYYGWQYRVEGAQAGMFKLGDRWTWNFDGRRNRFTVLSSDSDSQNLSNSWVHGTHPDKDGLMSLVTWDNENAIQAAGVAVAGKWVGSRWDTDASHERGDLDINHSFADGSVSRTIDVKHMTYGNDPDNEGDERMTRVPQWNTAYDGATGIVWTYLPNP